MVISLSDVEQIVIVQQLKMEKKWSTRNIFPHLSKHSAEKP